MVGFYNNTPSIKHYSATVGEIEQRAGETRGCNRLPLVPHRGRLPHPVKIPAEAGRVSDMKNVRGKALEWGEKGSRDAD